MKVFVFAFLLVTAGVNALPQQYFEDEYSSRDERIVTGNIRRAIEELAKSIKEAGLDPLDIDKFEFEGSFAPDFVTVKTYIESLEFTGLSNIAINRLDYGALTNRLRFDISLPLLSLSVGEAGVNANIFGTLFTGQLSGSLKITQIRLAGEIRVNIGIISGISLRSVDANFRVQRIESNLAMKFQDEDYSELVDSILNETIPQILEIYKDEIDKNLSEIIKEVGNQLLGKSVTTGDQVLIA
ncbi:uncharacterized protein LOC123864586 [Maniola jurtina]|uniref:uncharacterized protein LOC123864586 n=1 Tax=Maniola jurtina TaxID=191418 RepID=UPI001E68F351|nr:uncharacterized protein LOC123864586 [Maniola jurtina]